MQRTDNLRFVISRQVEMIDFPTRRVTEAEYLEAKKL